MKVFEGKVVIVTGASSGLGEATALKFGREGAKVVVAARREDRGRAVVEQIENEGGDARFVKTDVTKRADIENLIDDTVATFGTLDCAVNNAGIVGPVMVPMAEIEEEAWDELMNTNLKGPYFLAQLFAKDMIERKVSGILPKNVRSFF